jgi:hypothetical protein
MPNQSPILNLGFSIYSSSSFLGAYKSEVNPIGFLEMDVDKSKKRKNIQNNAKYFVAPKQDIFLHSLKMEAIHALKK